MWTLGNGPNLAPGPSLYPAGMWTWVLGARMSRGSVSLPGDPWAEAMCAIGNRTRYARAQGSSLSCGDLPPYAMCVLILSLIVATLAVARITRLLVEDELLVGYRRWVIRNFGEDGKMSYLAHCPWCTSIWVGAPVMPVATLWPNRWVIAALAIPAASMLTGLLLTAREN